MRFRSLVLSIVLAWAARPLAAQNALLSGIIRDQSKGVVQSALVTATNLATGVKRDTMSGVGGVYSFASLPLGKYRVSVKAAGFNLARSGSNARSRPVCPSRFRAGGRLGGAVDYGNRRSALAEHGEPLGVNGGESSLCGKSAAQRAQRASPG
jgi:hypothetical protein